MRYFTYGLFLYIVLFAGNISINEARAATRFCNETSHILKLAVAFQHGLISNSEGWFHLKPGACTSLLHDAPQTAELFLHAVSDPVHAGDVITYEGTERFCVQPTGMDFQIEGRRDCRKRGFMTGDFAIIDRNDRASVVRLSEHESFGTRALRAGIQRLLQDIGYDIGVIDGYNGISTRTAIADVQKQYNLATNMRSGVLFDKIYDIAETRRAKRGLHFCNNTPHMVWAAIGMVHEQGFQSRGWIRIPAQKCMQAINEDLTERYYFTYAEAVDEAGNILVQNGKVKNWGGDVFMCVKSTRFDIIDHDACTAQGLDRAGFRRIDTGADKYWMVNLD